jgi:hypothetical protein
VPGECDQITIAEPGAELGGSTEQRMRARNVALHDAIVGRCADYPTFRGTGLIHFVQQPPGARQPARRLRSLSRVLVVAERQPVRAVDGAELLAALEKCGMRARQRRDARLHVAHQIGSHGEPLEIISIERRLRISVRQACVGLGPGLLGEGRASALEHG